MRSSFCVPKMGTLGTSGYVKFCSCYSAISGILLNVLSNNQEGKHVVGTQNLVTSKDDLDNYHSMAKDNVNYKNRILQRISQSAPVNTMTVRKG